jgi:glycerol kinase
MAMGRYILALDEGSSSARTVVVDPDGHIVGEARAPVVWNRPRPGWVELDPVRLWRTQLETMHGALSAAGVNAPDIAAVAVTTHRETVLIWDRRTGEPVHDAIVWISHQTDDIVRRWQADGLDDEFRRRTGLRNDSFFSAAKLAWLLQEIPGLRGRAEAGELACGTIDCWLLWNLTGGRSHRTDHSCASRTALFNLESLGWDDELCGMLGIPMSLFPEAVASDSEFGLVDRGVLEGTPPVRAVLADQQASMYGQACFSSHDAKNTFGTAGVYTVNTGGEALHVDGLTSGVAWTGEGRTVFNLEGVVFHSGQTLQWVRENLGLIGSSAEIEPMATSVPDTGGVYLVPGFGGLSAPYWDRRARASITGVSLETRAAHVVRAAVEAMAYQTCDITNLTQRNGYELTTLKVDGGAAVNNLLCQFLADVSGLQILRPRALERTALGVAYMAGIGIGMWESHLDIEKSWQADAVFEPAMSADRREELYRGWQEAVARTLTRES